MELSAIQIYGIAMAGFGLLAAAFSYWFVLTWYAKSESPVPLALFRFSYASVLFCEICQLIYAEPLIYDRVPGVVDNNMSLLPVFYFWLANTALLALGWCTRFVTVTNFVLGLTVFAVSDQFEYHVDYVFTGINLLILFCPISAAWSVDAWMSKWDSRPQYMIPAVYSQMIVLFGIGVVYADSCFWKFRSVNWSSGIGVFAPASHPGFVWLDFSPILDSNLLSYGTGFLTLTFEAAFLFLMWFRFSRKILCVIGILLHIGILVVFPIPWFALTMLALYILVWPQYSNDPAPPSNRTPHRLSPAVAASPKSLRWVVAALLLAQFNASLAAPVPTEILAHITSPEESQQIAQISREVTSQITRPVFGIVTHPVFMDNHLQIANAQYRIVASNSTGTWNVPIATEEGLAHPLNSGRLWVHWMFRVAPNLQDQTARDELNRLLRFWALKQDKGLAGTTFSIEARSIPFQPNWQTNLLTTRRSLEWTTLWTIEWANEPKWTQVDLLPDSRLVAASPPPVKDADSAE